MPVEDYNQAVADALTGAYKSRRLKQEVLAQRADMSIWTLQKKLKGRAPVTATDLVMLARAIGVPAAAILERADELEAERRTDTDLAAERVEHEEATAVLLSERQGTVDPAENVTYLVRLALLRINAQRDRRLLARLDIATAGDLFVALLRSTYRDAQAERRVLAHDGSPDC